MADPDDTIIAIRRPVPPRRRTRWPALGAMAVIVGVGAGWFAWQAGQHASAPAPHLAAISPVAPAPVQPAPAGPTPTVAPVPQAGPPVLAPPALAVPAAPPLPAAPPVAPVVLYVPPASLPLATEAEILARAPAVTEAYRFGPQPEIIVLQFASLAEQANMLNRAAALLERAGYPRDHVLDDAELDRRIRAAGDTPERVYFGHDYRAADLLRFFAVADRTGVIQTSGELRLRRLIHEWGWTPETNGALISLAREDAHAGLDRPIRATILRHELSHGLYFTDPEYAKFSRDFYDGTLTRAERGHFRAFLASEGYDTSIEDLVINETQAYLMHTASAKFFTAGAVGIPDRRLDTLRALFLTGMPPGWLRDCTTVAAPAR